MHHNQKTIVAESHFIRDAEYFPLLDYLRAFAALGVLLSHSDTWHIFPENFGNGCVQMFFALSGFLIGGILLRSSPSDIPRFYFNRSTRIWIPYFIAIALVMAVTVLKQPLSDPKIWEITFYDATFVYNLFGTSQLSEYVNRFPLNGTANHFWSICVEEQFYLIAPFVLLLFGRVLVWILVALVVFNFFLPHIFASISVGFMLAMSRRQFGDWYQKFPFRIMLSVIAGAIFFVLFLKPALYSELIPLAAGAIVAVLAAIGRQHDLGRIIGGMSYPFYLNSWLVFFTLNYMLKLCGIILPSMASLSIGLAGALIFSYLHYIFIDQRIIAARRGWFTKTIGISACAAGFILFSMGVVVGLGLIYTRI